MTRIKICGLFRDCDIDYVNEACPDYVGFIVNFPQSHRSIDIQCAARLRRRLAPGIRAAGVFVDRPAQEVIRAAQEIGLDAVQLHGSEDGDDIRAVRAKTGLPVWKAFRIRSEEDLAAARISPADRILLDNGYGTGSAFDWSLVGSFCRPYILAGGLTPESIPQAVRILHPEMVDLSSGVETDRVKDREKILAAVRAVRQGSAQAAGDAIGRMSTAGTQTE